MICGIHRGGSKGRGEQRPQLMLCSPSRIETQGLGLGEQRQENVCKQPARFARQAWIYFSDHYFSGEETQLMMGLLNLPSISVSKLLMSYWFSPFLPSSRTSSQMTPSFFTTPSLQTTLP